MERESTPTPTGTPTTVSGRRESGTARASTSTRPTRECELFAASWQFHLSLDIYYVPNCSSSIRYNGEWVNGIKQGKGVYTFGSGDVFTGSNNVYLYVYLL